ncbi:MAG: S8/S53 family peptidase [bacterium]
MTLSRAPIIAAAVALATAFSPAPADAQARLTCPNGEDAPSWIALVPPPIRPGEGCPVVADWEAQPLFPGAVAGPLQQFCRYARTRVRAVSPRHARIIDASPDCAIVTSQAAPSPRRLPGPIGPSPDGSPQLGDGHPLVDTVAPRLHAAHIARWSLPTPPPAVRNPVLVAVLDTIGDQTSYPSADDDVPLETLHSTHGPAMQAIISAIAPDARIDAIQAMPEGNDDPSHGHYGRLGQLAVALYHATTVGAGERLVINLSLGWDPANRPPRMNPASDAALPSALRHLAGRNLGVSELAVYAAVSHAACTGALVVASAGNDPLGLGETGSLLPAAWAQDVLPARLCDGFARAPLGNRPLLLAVGGVDLRDRRLSNARNVSTPRLVAPAEQAAVRLPVGDWVVLTGTSVAAAVASGAAAAVWQQRPGATAADVAAALYQGGVRLGRPAEVRHAGSTFEQRRLSVCGALAIGDPGLVCATPSAGDAATDEALAAALRAELVADATLRDPAESIDGVPPAWDFAATRDMPTIAPQPDDPWVPDAVVRRHLAANATDDLLVDLPSAAPAFVDATLSVKTRTDNGDIEAHIDLSAQFRAMEPAASRTARVKLPKLAPGEVASAWLSFTVQSPKTGDLLAKATPIKVIDVPVPK